MPYVFIKYTQEKIKNILYMFYTSYFLCFTVYVYCSKYTNINKVPF